MHWKHIIGFSMNNGGFLMAATDELIQQIQDPVLLERIRAEDLTKLAVREKVLAALTNIELDHIFDTEGE